MVPTCFAHDFSIRIISRKMIAISLFFVRSVAQSLLPGNWWCRSYQKLVMSQDLHIGLQEIMPWMKKHSGTMTMRYPGFTSLLLDVYSPCLYGIMGFDLYRIPIWEAPSWTFKVHWTLMRTIRIITLSGSMTFSVLLMKPPEKSLSVAVASRPLHCSRRGIGIHRNPSE